MLLHYGRRRRRGTILVWFALVAFVMMGLAALTIDLGMVRVTQLAMQSAAESAAVEAVRARDRYRVDPELIDANYARRSDSELQTKCDLQRRLLAARLVQLALADVGAGPTFHSVGQAGYAAVTNGLPGVYQPQPELNLDDNLEGDMLAGRCINSPSVLHQEGVAGPGSFERDDFEPEVLEFGRCMTDAFLVRLRRSNDAPESGVASTGPVLPYLLGHGSL